MSAKAGYPIDIAAIARDSLGEAMIADVRRRLDLPGPPIRSAEAPEHLLMILFASRAGSTYAGQLLAQTPHFERVGEAFNVPQLHRLRLRHGLPDDAAMLRWIIAHWGTPHAFGAKCGLPGLAGALATGFLEANFPRISFVILDRRDRLAQAVSLYRAELSGRFHARQRARRRIASEDYDREEIAQRIDVIGRVYETFDCFLETTGKHAQRFWYEDLAVDPQGFVNSVCDHAGLARPGEVDTVVRTRKLADDINAAWIERFRAGR